MVRIGGFEPSTHRLKVCCSTVWTIPSLVGSAPSIRGGRLYWANCAFHGIFALLFSIPSPRLTDTCVSHLLALRVCGERANYLGRLGLPLNLTYILYHTFAVLSRGFWKIFATIFQKSLQPFLISKPSASMGYYLLSFPSFYQSDSAWTRFLFRRAIPSESVLTSSWLH